MEYHERLIPGTADWKENIAGHMQRYHFAGRFVAGKRVLDAGCGVGYGSGILLRAGASEVIGVDVSQGAVEIARKQFCRPGIRFVQEDCQSLDSIHGEFDVIVAFESLEHFQEPRRFLSRARDVLRESGALICSTPNSHVSEPGVNGKPANPYHVQEYRLKELQSLLAEFFGDTLLYGQRFTAALTNMALLAQLRSNPFVRLGRMLQRMRHPMSASVGTAPHIMPTEGDYVISEANLEDAFVFLAVCRCPQKGQTAVEAGSLARHGCDR